MRIAEIFESISGEVGGFPQGSPCTFVRLAGCNLRCPFCDTAWAINQNAGQEMEIEAVVQKVLSYPWNQVLVTGGEPLVQSESLKELIRTLRMQGRSIKTQLETNGSLPLSWASSFFNYCVLDHKGQAAMGAVPYTWIHPPIVAPNSVWVKFLVGSLGDIDRAIAKVRTISPRIIPAISALTEDLATAAVQKIIESGLPILLNVQLHKKIGVR